MEVTNVPGEEKKPTFFQKFKNLFTTPKVSKDDEREADAVKAMEQLGAERMMTPSPSVTQYEEHQQQPKWRKYLKINLTIAAIFLSIIVGILLRSFYKDSYTKREIMYVGFIGTIYLRILQGLAAPLLVVSILSSLSKLNLRLAGIVGIRALIYFIVTTSIAIGVGISLVYIIQPGKNFISDNEPGTKQFVRDTTITDTFLDLIRNALPSNLVQAYLYIDRTDLDKPQPEFSNKTVGNKTIVKSLPLPPKDKWDFATVPIPGTNFLGLIFTAVIFSLFLGMRKTRDTIIIDLVDDLNDILILVLQASLWFTPPGVFFLVVSKILEMKNWGIFFGQVGLYSLTVFVGLMIHLLIVLPILYMIFVRRLPFLYFYNLTEAMITAFATSSSLATLPVTLDCVERKNKIPVIVARFVISLGATINMDGTALYEAVAPLFIAQVRKMEVPFLELFLMSLTALLASVGAAGIPQAGLVIMVIVFDIIGIDPQDISYIILVDWLLDRFRTMTNIVSDSVGAAIVYKLSKKKLEQYMEEGFQKND